MDTLIGCGQITWPRGSDPDDVLADIAQAGYDGAPWGGPPGTTAQQVRERFDKHGLRPAPGYLGLDLWHRDARDSHLEAAARHARVAAELGLTEVYLAVGGFETTGPSGRTRRQSAGHAGPGDALPPAEFDALCEGVRAVAERTLAEGVRSCFHNHVGTFVETADEFGRLLDAVGADVLLLGPDTGHLAWAGIDAAAFTAEHADRIATMHLKDVFAQVAARGREQGWDYGTCEREGVWTEIGEGDVDFASILATLSARDFGGWLIVETDVTRKPSALDSAVACRQALRALGV